MRRRDLATLLYAAAFALILPLGPAAAHPLGNATVNRQAALAVSPGRVSLDFRMDMAEIPSLAAEAQADANGDGTVEAAEWRREARRWAISAQAGLLLQADGRPLAWRLERAEHELGVGEAGLPLLRLHARYTAALPAGTTRLALQDDFRPQDRGWREIWMGAADGVEVAGAVARADRSQGLRSYPAGQPPPDERLAEVALRLPPPGPAVRAEAAAMPPVPSRTGRAQAAPPAPASSVPVSPAGGQMSSPPPEPAAPVAPEAEPPAVEPVPAADAPAPSLPAMFGLGMHHILTGFDHLAFLAGLLLISRGWRRAAGVVTAFTLAHSLSLLLAARGLVAVPPMAVESAIALSVAWVGALAVAGRGGAHGFGLAFAFGLVHGLGFAGALAETLGDGQVTLLPLLAFNLGIEACQLALVAVALGLAGWLRRGRLATGLHRLASLAVTGGGLVWFVARVAA